MVWRDRVWGGKHVGEGSRDIIGGRHRVVRVQKNGSLRRKRWDEQDAESRLWHRRWGRGAWSMGRARGRGQALRLEFPGVTPGTPERNENPPPKYRLGDLCVK